MFAAGCGGDDAALATDGTTAAPTPTTPAADTNGSLVGDDTAGQNLEGAEDDTPGVNEIQNANARTGLMVTVSKITPKKFAAAHCTKPIMVVYYQPGSGLEQKLLAEARTAAAKMSGSGLVTLVYTPKDVKAFGDLPAKLGLLSTPGLAIVGRDGKIENFWVTYVDNALILRSLKNAAANKACDGSEAPATGEESALANAATVANGGTLPDAAAEASGTAPADGSDALPASTDPTMTDVPLS